MFAVSDGLGYKFNGLEFALIRDITVMFDLRDPTPVTEEEAMRISS